MRGAASLCLEVGTGSGRMTRPLLDQGLRLIGVDLSMAKLRRLTRDPLPLAQADAIRLPFADASFDALITIHVMHLINDGHSALKEFRRVLAPGGVYLRRREHLDPLCPRFQLRGAWQSLLEENGLPQRHGAREGDRTDIVLQEMGAACRPRRVAERLVDTTPRLEIERIADRARQGAWRVPTAMLDPLIAALTARAADLLGDLDARAAYRESFILHVWRFDAVL